MTNALRARIGLTLFYGTIWALEVWRCVSILSKQSILRQPSYWNIALYAYFALAGWLFLGRAHRMSDRIASLLYGLVFALKIGAFFVEGDRASVLMWQGASRHDWHDRTGY